MKIGLLRCDKVLNELLPIAGDYPEAFENIFSAYARDISLQVYDVLNGEYPDTLDECHGYITTGSKSSVYEKEKWITDLLGFIKSLYTHNIKFVGICFGHQLIAEALGGKCAESENGWGIGVKQVKIVKKKTWMQPELESYNLLVSHVDQIVKLPPDNEVLGTNDHCPNSMFTVGDRFLGIQAHPEFTPAYAEALMLSRIDRIGADMVATARESLSMELHIGAITCWIRNFFYS